ncbi:MAG: sugar phosphate isomerase/epimerase family protein [Candidatus Nitrosopumilus sp. bin_6a]
MKIGFSSNAFIKTTLYYGIKKLSEFGYDGIEIVLDSPHAFLPLTNEEVSKIQNSLKENHLEISNLNSNTVSGFDSYNKSPFEPSLSNKNENLRNWRISYTKKAIDLASRINSPSISITSGLMNKSNQIDEFDFFKNSLKLLAEYAEQKNILLGIEYEPGLLVNNSEDLWDLISNDFKNIGLNLDTCHAAVLNEDISKIIQKFKKKIFHTHISDCKNNVHFHLIPGLGEINFQEIYISLKKVNYSGYLTAELYPYSEFPEEAASKAFIYLTNLTK